MSLTSIASLAQRVRFRQHLQHEMAHYAQDCWDAEVECSYGWVECVGLADRAAFDLDVRPFFTCGCSEAALRYFLQLLRIFLEISIFRYMNNRSDHVQQKSYHHTCLYSIACKSKTCDTTCIR